MIKKLLAKLNNKDLLIIFIILLINILPRLLYLLNNGVFIDGDEAIFGVMIRDFLNNGHLPLFFYGQNYGFVSFEVLLSSIISWFFGASLLTMKISMLIFWLASVIVLYYIGKKIFLSRKLSLLSVALVSFVPVWFDWAAKARGGYLTALLLSNIIILLTVSKKNIFRIIIISLSFIFIYYAQPLWLIVVLPFVAFYFLNDFKFKYASIFSISTLVFWSFSRFLLTAFHFSYQLQNKLGADLFIRNVKNIFNNYTIAYSGRFLMRRF